MKIAEIFHSIQGEGSLVGIPSVFVRTSGCNLRCKWCDTPYTSWQPEGQEISLEEIMQAVAHFRCEHIVLTGGEPMISPEVDQLTRLFHDAHLHITIETAGTIYREVACDLISISPKLANSTPWERDGGRWATTHERLRYQPNVLKQLTTQYEYQLKFVITDEQDIEEVRSMQTTLEAPSNRIILMAEGITREALNARGVWLAEICKENGYRYSPRLHIDLWGNRRGI